MNKMTWLKKYNRNYYFRYYGKYNWSLKQGSHYFFFSTEIHTLYNH